MKEKYYLEPREDLDKSIVGEHEGRNVYEFEALVRCFADHFTKSNPSLERGEALDQASDWVDYNVIGSLSSLGDKSPLIVYEIGEEILDDFIDESEDFIVHEDAELFVMNGKTWQIIS